MLCAGRPYLLLRPCLVAYYATYLPLQLMGASEPAPKPVVNELLQLGFQLSLVKCGL
jgi:hypothetical protein